MRAKLSTTADGTYSAFAPPAPVPSNHVKQDAVLDNQPAVLHDQFGGESHDLVQSTPRRSGTNLHRQSLLRAGRVNPAAPSDLRGEGLLHDARNLVSAIGLYCDLLSMPGVLKPEHKQYPEELRLLGTRSRVLIEHLLRSLVAQNLSNQNSNQNSGGNSDQGPSLLDSPLPDSQVGTTATSIPRTQAAASFRRTDFTERPQPLNLRATVERCSGLLSRVASGRPIDLVFGPAADVPVAISEEAIERILINLVRNASQALDRRQSLSSNQPAIRILVGPLLDRIGEARSWPFQHVRLVVEDGGCGMPQKQLHSLLSSRLAGPQAGHGIGFRVVRELVATSQGELCVASTPGVGTQVQIEWPVAATPTTEKDRVLMQRKFGLDHPLHPSPSEPRHRSLPATPQSSTTLAGRQGVN